MKLLILIGSVALILNSFSTAQQCPSSSQCIKLRECDSLYRIVSSSPVSPSDTKYLQSRSCGLDGHHPLVCCPTQQTINRAQSILPTPGTPECGQFTPDRVFGGRKTRPVEFPWMAIIYYKYRNRGRFLCGGSLINENYILTAAHCVDERQLEGFVPKKVRLGAVDITRRYVCDDDTCVSSTDIPVREADITIHEDYSRVTHQNDIALIRLKRSVRYTVNIRPVCLPSTQLNLNYDGVNMTVIGFGRTETGEPSKIRLAVDLKGFNWNACEDVFSVANVDLTSNQLCAGGEAGKDSCNGDSGGPLVTADYSIRSSPYYYLIGIVSFGHPNCGTAGYPGVYTRVDKYLNWIRDHVEP